MNLARQSAAAGVKRFIFISSIGVNGRHEKNISVKNGDVPNPWNDFTQSNRSRTRAFGNSGRNWIGDCHYPPTFGVRSGAPGNFGKLISAVSNERWLPLGAINNQRSFVALDNLLDLIFTCISHPNAANQTFLVSDDQDVSTSELLKMMASAFGKKSRLIPVPMGLIQFVANLLGKRAMAQRLCSSLVVDIWRWKRDRAGSPRDDGCNNWLR